MKGSSFLSWRVPKVPVNYHPAVFPSRSVLKPTQSDLAFLYNSIFSTRSEARLVAIADTPAAAVLVASIAVVAAVVTAVLVASTAVLAAVVAEVVVAV